VEAYALMTSGYCMTENALRESALGFPIPDARRENWEFLKIEPLMKQPGDTPLMRQLKVAEKLALRIWILSHTLKALGTAAGVLLLAWIAYYAYAHWSVTAFSLTVGALLTTVICFVLGAVGWGFLAKIIQYRKTFQSILIGISMGTLGWLLARLHLHVFDRWFLSQGRLSALSREEG
jgi:hypothetical protein